jgi:Gluconate 2-dehydrogenase subunit 3
MFNKEELLTRRELAELALRAAAFPGAAAFFSAWLTAAQSNSHPGIHHMETVAPPQPTLLQNYEPKFFAPEDFEALQAFTQILIPTDDTPGAREAYCAHYIDFVLQASSEMPQTQKNWRNAMEKLKATGFHAAAANRRLDLVAEMSRPEVDHAAQHPAFSAYQLIKQQTAFAFYTSRKGMIETLDYKGNSYNVAFPACNHPEHQTV